MDAEKEIIKYLKDGYSDAYIEAVMYGKYQYKYGIEQISKWINKHKNICHGKTI